MRDHLADPAFPDDALVPSTCAAEGIDPDRLERAVRTLEERRWPIHALLVLRHGRLVLERYGRWGWWRLGPADRHPVYSVTKTVISALVGIALAEGKISSLSAPVLGWFPEEVPGRAEKAGMTVEDLLTMRSGLDYHPATHDRRMRRDRRGGALSILSLPLAASPGTSWRYSSGDSQVLAELLRRAVGEPVREYAARKLFQPLGVAPASWQRDRTGTEMGGFGLSLRPRELARLGLLYLARGRWRGAQLVPAAWVDASTRGRVPTPWVDGTYGYQVWATRFGGFAMRGYGGQNVYVLPVLDLVVVTNAWLPGGKDAGMLDVAMVELVLPAVR